MYLLDGNAGLVRVYDLTTVTLKRSVAVSSSPTSLAISPDGKQLWVTHSTPAQVTVYTGSVANGFISTGVIPMTSVPLRVYFNPSGSIAAITNTGGWVDIVR